MTQPQDREHPRALPALTVIVPVLDGESLLPISLGALADSDLPRDEWRLVVVDDGSTDETVRVAERWADQVVRVPGGPKGPGFARNLGARSADGDVLVLVDADVRVHPDTLRRIRAHFVEDDVGAVFGTYDDQPSASSFLSQYRNLYHRYVHLRGAGEAETFWAGCGAVRRDLYLRLGGFDTVQFPRPQIEDIELGYRIRDAGYRILLDPTVEATHLKRWTFRQIVRTDLFDRGIPWMRLLLRSGRRPTLNVGGTEKLKTALLGVSCALLAIALALLDPTWALAALVPLGMVVVMNLDVYRWFAQRRGWVFALGVIPMNLLYYLISGLAVVGAVTLHLLRDRTDAAREAEGPA